jgi:3D (Asp-Asp-Asp) domain-containing protein
MGVTVSPYDAVMLNGTRAALDGPALAAPQFATVSANSSSGASPDTAGMNIQLKRAVPLTLDEDGLAMNLQSSQATIADVLHEAGVALGPADEISPPPSTPVTAGMQIEVNHADSITLHIGGSTRVLYTHQETLEAALAEAGLTFGPDDRVEPSLDVAVTNGMDARLVRVSGREIEESEPVKHITVFRPDDSLSGTQTRRVQGSDGVKVDVYTIRIEDGVELEKTWTRQYFEPEPVDTVIYYAPSALQSTGIDPSQLQVSSTMRVYATWYNAASSGKAATDPSYGITKSGSPVTKGIVAVDPSVIPLGTRLYIPGYGFAIAGDTGGGIKGNMIDLGFPDGVSVDWNTSWTDVYILS